MHGRTLTYRQWPPENSRKQYDRFEVVESGDFILESNQASGPEVGVPFSLKEILPTSQGLKDQFRELFVM